MEVLIGLFVCIGAFLILYAVIYPVILSYEITGNNIHIKYFGFISIARIPFDSITDIKVCGVFDDEVNQGFWTQRLGNRLTKTCVLIKTRTGFGRYVITPLDPEKFVEEVKAGMNSES